MLIYGRNMLCRQGFVFKSLKTEDGVFTGAVFGILNCLLRLRRYYPEAKLVMVWDGKEATSKGWRRAFYPEYKANRNHGGNPDMINLLSQINLVQETLA